MRTLLAIISRYIAAETPLRLCRTVASWLRVLMVHSTAFCGVNTAGAPDCRENLRDLLRKHHSWIAAENSVKLKCDLSGAFLALEGGGEEGEGELSGHFGPM